MNENNPVFAVLDELKQPSPQRLKSTKQADAPVGLSYTEWHIASVRIADLTSLPAAPHIRVLYLTDCIQLKSLAGLAAFPALQKLFLYGSDKLEDIEALRDCSNLAHLTISSSFNGKVKLPSLQPLEALSHLSDLYLDVVAEDRRLEPLFGLGNLKHLLVGNVYLWDEFARLEYALPDLHFMWRSGVVHDALPKILKCKKCDTPLSMLTGFRKGTACPACDTTKIDKHLQDYRAIACGDG